MLSIGMLVSGRGTNLQSIIDSVESKRLDAAVKIIISSNPEAYALERAKKHNIPFKVITKEQYPSKEAFDKEIVRTLKDSGVELVALAGYMRILSGIVINAFPMRIMNIHPSLLPSFTGLDVHRKALDYGVKFSGCTVHFVDEGLDTGPIIIQAAVPVLENDTPESLAKRILEEEHRIYPQAIRLYGEGRLVLKGRRVFVKDCPEPKGTLENPRVALFD